MRFGWIFGGMALAVATPAMAMSERAVKPPINDVDELARLNAARLDAYRTRDRAVLERILAEDFVAVRANGMAQSKEMIIEAATSPARNIRRVAWDNVQIHVRGDMAFVTGRSYLEGTSEGRDISAANQYADVYMKRDGRWEAVAARIVRAEPGARPPSP